MTTDNRATIDRHAREELLRRALGDGVLPQLIAEFSEAFAFARTRWTRVADETHPELKGGALVLLSTIVRRGPITATEIGHFLTLDKGLVSRHVTQLKELGYVESAPSPHDRRVVFLTGTETAKEALDSIHIGLAHAYQERLASWSSDELESLMAMLRKFNGTNRNIADPSKDESP